MFLVIHTVVCFITLCTYAWQGYAFGHVSLCVRMYTDAV